VRPLKLSPHFRRRIDQHPDNDPHNADCENGKQSYWPKYPRETAVKPRKTDQLPRGYQHNNYQGT
jgi:hypothetical protein